ncbi:TetR/AcrR family transcriptional regulator [Chryseobacterium daeguense]|uniref:TetR/AcrR family transcriptional regulator n=1 Tax=Chryseobacterium daeguense TaxID=412438 RepID=UPI000424344C|nr:TetR/AcrR family transcriptional regulator [Chryseobacterium daeguense]
MARLVEFDEKEAIEKAMKVFWKKGYASTSMRDLTDAMQINSSSLYNTIGDKKQLFIKCIKNYTQFRIQSIEERYKHWGSPFEALENFIRDAANIITTEPNTCLCLKTTFETEGGNAEINTIINSYDHFNHQFIKNLIEKAQHLNEMPKNGNPEMISDYLMSVVSGWYNSFVLHQNPDKILDMAEFVIRQLKR